jgi:hypothetical protein
VAQLTTGQKAVSASAAALTAAATQIETLILKAHPDNSAVVYFGDSTVTTSTGYPLDAGEEFQIAPGNGPLGLTPKPSEIYVIGTSGTVAWVATPR